MNKTAITATDEQQMEITARPNSTALPPRLSVEQSSAVASPPAGHDKRTSPPPQRVANTRLKYTFYGKNKIAVTVIDKGSGRTIREIPSAELQKLSEQINEMIGSVDEVA